MHFCSEQEQQIRTDLDPLVSLPVCGVLQQTPAHTTSANATAGGLLLSPLITIDH